MAYKGNPLDNLKVLAKAGIPIIHVVGDTDKIVPLAENTAIAEARYKKMGGVFKVIHKKTTGHHPHSLKDPKPIVDFIAQHSGGTSRNIGKPSGSRAGGSDYGWKDGLEKVRRRSSK